MLNDCFMPKTTMMEILLHNRNDVNKETICRNNLTYKISKLIIVVCKNNPSDNKRQVMKIPTNENVKTTI